MAREMSLGDAVLFYHSTCAVPGVYGLAKVASKAYPDQTQFEVGKYFDSRASCAKPVWFCVDVAFEKKFERPVLLSEIRKIPELSGMRLLQKGNRLSITPVEAREYETIVQYSAE